MCFFFSGYGDHRDLHVLTHSFPTRRSSDLDAHAARIEGGVGAAVDDDAVVPGQLDEVAVAPDARIGLEVGGAVALVVRVVPEADWHAGEGPRSEEHTSELQSLMRISYAVFCLKKKKHTKHYDIENDV